MPPVLRAKPDHRWSFTPPAVHAIMACCDIFDVFDEKHLLLKEYAHWKLILRNRNTTLGNCVAITKRHMERFSEITQEELADFQHVLKDVESACDACFKNDKINYMMLMMKDKHTHFHIFPRYAFPKTFAGLEWTDEGWPLMPPAQKPSVSPETLQQIKKAMLKCIK